MPHPSLSFIALAIFLSLAFFSLLLTLPHPKSSLHPAIPTLLALTPILGFAAFITLKVNPDGSIINPYNRDSQLLLFQSPRGIIDFLLYISLLDNLSDTLGLSKSLAVELLQRPGAIPEYLSSLSQDSILEAAKLVGKGEIPQNLLPLSEYTQEELKALITNHEQHLITLGRKDKLWALYLLSLAK